MIEFYVCMVDFHHNYNLYNKLKKYKNLPMSQTTDYYVIYYGAIPINKQTDGVKIKEVLAIHLGLNTLVCFVKNKI